ncbi:MAG: family 20 glycosylhydrolase [Bacteroidales bacterium]
MFNLEMKGIRSGGSDRPGGIALPEFQKIVPLTPAEEERLLGGEACMWTEMSDARTLESRIWPRAAAVAEKLWSPAVSTGDAADMYRRLWILDEGLEGIGLAHRSYRSSILAAMGPGEVQKALARLADVLQEDKFFNRMVLYQPALFTTTPLDRMVDAASPESRTAWQFDRDVQTWLDTGDARAEERIRKRLETWTTLGADLELAAGESERIAEVLEHAQNLSHMAAWGLLALDDPDKLPPAGETDAFFAEASQARGATLLAVCDPVQKLLRKAQAN